MMNNFFNMNLPSGSCSVEETSPIVGQQVWQNAVPNQGYTPNHGRAIASNGNYIYHNQLSRSPRVRIGMNATRNDWEAYLKRINITSQTTQQFHDPATSLGVSAVGKIMQPRNHYAHNSLFVPSSPNGLTSHQLAVLEEVFRGKPYVTSEERRVLGCKLGISDQAIKIWYHNRRLLERKEREELELELLQELPQINQFAHTEALINHADRDGFVTLDQQSMDELVGAIDKILPKDLDLAKLVFDLGRTNEVKESSPNVNYEPISLPEVGTSSRVSCTYAWQKVQTYLRLLGAQSFNCT